jgi:hypothetical protein
MGLRQAAPSLTDHRDLRPLFGSAKGGVQSGKTRADDDEAPH